MKTTLLLLPVLFCSPLAAMAAPIASCAYSYQDASGATVQPVKIDVNAADGGFVGSALVPAFSKDLITVTMTVRSYSVRPGLTSATKADGLNDGELRVVFAMVMQEQLQHSNDPALVARLKLKFDLGLVRNVTVYFAADSFFFVQTKGEDGKPLGNFLFSYATAVAPCDAN